MHQMQNEQLHAQMEQKQIEQTLKGMMQQILEPEARERLANLKMVKPELALQLEAYLAQVYQTGQMRGRLTDEKMVEILKKLAESEKKDFRIKRITK